ncbi:MAG: CRISPR-associated endonuclease Cas1 [Halanaerobiales bacterium]
MEELCLDQYGLFLGKKSERLFVRKKKEIVKEVPLFKISKVLVTSKGISLSTDAIEECMKRGIKIDFINYRNEPYAEISSPFLQGTVQTRRAQLFAYENKKGVELVKSFVYGKVMNQILLLKYMSKYRKKRNPELYEYMIKQIETIENYVNDIETIEGEKVDDIRQNLMTLEAHCAKDYWQTVKMILPDNITFTGRETRGATDLVNCLLNYGYAILYSQVQGAIIRAGLDPFAGFLHVDRAGRASLVLDFMEEFRQQTIDKTVFAMLNQGIKLSIKDGRIEEESKKKLRNKINQKFDSYVKYEDKKHKLRVIIQKQARHMATFLRGERNYESFIGNW